MAATGDLLDLSLREFLEAVASEDPTPGGGTAAALAVAISAGLTAMVARASGDWPEAGSAVAQAERLRKRIAPLAQRDAEAYEEALVSMTLPERVEPVVRDMAVGAALWRAAEVPMAIADAGSDAACLAAIVADRGTPEPPCGRGRRGASCGSRDVGCGQSRPGEPDHHP